jgi:hypothetical protein
MSNQIYSTEADQLQDAHVLVNIVKRVDACFPADRRRWSTRNISVWDARVARMRGTTIANPVCASPRYSDAAMLCQRDLTGLSNPREVEREVVS